MKELARESKETLCPCGSERPYAQCCGPLHAGEAAATAQALMRSRYSAFVLGKADYLQATWHASTREADLELDPVKWLGLKIVGTEDVSETEAYVEFVACGRFRGRGFRQHEKSRFLKEDGRWYYVDGEVFDR